MDKYYKYNVGKHKVVFLKVYENKPDDLHKVFIESKLIACEEFSLHYTVIGGKDCRCEISNLKLVAEEDLELKLRVYKAKEITNEDYYTNLDKVTTLRRVFLNLFEGLKDENIE